MIGAEIETGDTVAVIAAPVGSVVVVAVYVSFHFSSFTFIHIIRRASWEATFTYIDGK
jgi:hypothetical protein